MAPISPFEQLTTSLEHAQDWSALAHILEKVESAYQQAHILQTQAESLALAAAVLSQTITARDPLKRLAA